MLALTQFTHKERWLTLKGKENETSENAQQSTPEQTPLS